MKARLVSSAEIAPGVNHFVFEAEAEAAGPLRFTAGQFVSFTELIEGKPVTRAYSLASAPSSSNTFELCLNRVDDGRLSPHLFAMRPGDTIEMTGPLGTFTLREPARDSILIATGTGITPFRSFLQAYLPQGTPSFTLLFGVRHESHLLYRTEFEDYVARYPQFRFWPTLTQPPEDWKGRTGRVQAHLFEAIGERRNIDLYLCGLKPMVDDVRAILKEMGFDRKQIRYEKYD
ncbi:MAG: FAD-binding oxidoreductase [Acidobacteriota bacterium]